MSNFRKLPALLGSIKTTTRRHLSRGALAGGFNKEGLKRWAAQEWHNDTARTGCNDKTGELYVDMFSHSLTKECATWLDTHRSPSIELGKSYFGSNHFLPERIGLTPFFYQHSDMPTRFEQSDSFLVWTVAVRAPLEIICTWNGPFRGCTMLAFDPKLRKVFHGTCIHTASTSPLQKSLTPFHIRYSKFLLTGMVQQLENEALKLKS